MERAMAKQSEVKKVAKNEDGTCGCSKEEAPLCSTCDEVVDEDEYAVFPGYCSRCGCPTSCADCGGHRSTEGEIIPADACEDDDDNDDEESTMTNALKNTMRKSKHSAVAAGGMLAARVPNKQLVKLVLKRVPKKDYPWAHSDAGRAALEILAPHLVMLAADYGRDSLPHAAAVGSAAHKALTAAMFENGAVLQTAMAAYLAPFWGEVVSALKPLMKEGGREAK